MPDKTIAIIGCGWLGLPLGSELAADGYRVKGSTTTPEKLTRLEQASIQGHLLRLNPEPDGELETLLQADVLLIDIPPKAGKQGDAFHPAQIKNLTDAIRQSSIKHVIYVSSTSVYSELNRIMVEEDVTEVSQSASPALVQAEQYVQSLAPDRLVTIVRCGGLMGYDRIPGKYVAGRTVDSGEVPVNYLHRNDAIGLLKAVITQSLTGVYNAVAPEHPTREAIYRKSCADFGYALPTFIEPVNPVPYKIISPEKIMSDTGYQFQYPNPLDFLYELGA
ncbi:NAD(P)H-binding protein [Spirosoma fluviale]|uniref:Nucleoside-diphosphate-sugar epimerase n=1 Tax=Spirosoma fluviale TaxID=1597977 RepID=A0A286GKK2_9BACT|nr:NAD(P)H-binding protein [Spirosoma fluviale]SOD96065.1 Nucleoside-diphosphate-sugar epimerase [Spirosoma fluviale]